MKFGTVLCSAACMTMVAGLAAGGPKWDISEDSSMQLSVLGQVHWLHEEDALQKDDIYLRRGRIILSGQIMDGVKFFAETDNANAGKSGTDVATELQDIFADVRLLKTDLGEHWLAAGLILLPFSFESRSSAGSLLGIDYNSSTIKMVNTFAWRDYGATLHGNFGDRISYVAGAFDGCDRKGNSKNPDADLRFTGHAAVNVVGKAETSWFYNQLRFPKESYLSLGAGADTQNKATFTVPKATEGKDPLPGVVDNSNNYVLDVQSAWAIREAMSLTFNAGYYFWDNASFKGDTLNAETGLLVEKTMVSLKYELQDPDAGDQMQDYTAGLHYFLKGHNARAGIEYRFGDNNDQVLLGMQFML